MRHVIVLSLTKELAGDLKEEKWHASQELLLNSLR